jgi:hypothetical protein
MPATIEPSPKVTSRRRRVAAVAFLVAVVTASVGLVALVIASAVVGQDASPGDVAAIAGVAVLPACVAIGVFAGPTTRRG